MFDRRSHKSNGESILSWLVSWPTLFLIGLLFVSNLWLWKSARYRSTIALDLGGTNEFDLCVQQLEEGFINWNRDLKFGKNGLHLQTYISFLFPFPFFPGYWFFQ